MGPVPFEIDADGPYFFRGIGLVIDNVDDAMVVDPEAKDREAGLALR